MFRSIYPYLFLVLLFTAGPSHSQTKEMCPNVTVNTSATICQGDSLLLGGSFRKSAGLYTDSLLTYGGCDSIVNTSLSVLTNTVQQQSVSICPGDTLHVGPSMYTQPGNYLDSLPAYNGCDSIVYTSLSFVPPVVGQQAVLLCQGDSAFLQGKWRTRSGLFRDTLTSVVTGCDSILLSTVTAINLLDSVVNNNNTLQSLQTNVNYQWMECVGDTVVPGATSAFFKPPFSGSFKVVLSYGGCQDTSSCISVGYASIDEYLDPESITIFPNPAHDKFHVKLIGPEQEEWKLTLISVDGRQVKELICKGSECTIDISDLSPGLYFVGIGSHFQRLMVR